jgi:prepilin signal peptidase PulO-like enzyme (type II secretory pathway)
MLFAIQPLDWVAVAVVGAFLVPIVVVDLRRFLILDDLVFGGTVVLFCYLVLWNDQRLLPALVHGALGFAVIFAFWIVFKKQIGLGDAKLSFFLAAGLGFIEWWGALFIASLFAMTYGLVRIKMKKMTLKDKLPLAPFFGIGAAGIVALKLCLWPLLR